MSNLTWIKNGSTLSQTAIADSQLETLPNHVFLVHYNQDRKFFYLEEVQEAF